MLTEFAHPGLHDYLFGQLPSLPPGPVLDIACGSGAWLSRFTDRERVGIERDAVRVKAPGVELLVGDLDRDEISLGERRFALISAIEVIEHLENPGRLIAIAARHLLPSGWLLISTPNVHSIVARSRWLLRGSIRFFDGPWSDPTHINVVTLTWLERVLPRHGLRVERVWGHESGHTALQWRAAARALHAFVPEVLGGDTMCVLARRA